MPIPQPTSGAASAIVCSWLATGSFTGCHRAPSQWSVKPGPPTVQPSVGDASATSDTPPAIGLVTTCHVLPFQWRISPKMPNATPKLSATTASVESTGSPATGHRDHAPLSNR